MFLIVCGLFASFIYSFLILSNTEKLYPKINPTIFPIMYNGMVIIPYNKTNAIHFHHWFLFLIICIIRMFIYIPDIIFGFSVGLFIQGLTYKDRLEFICNNPYK